MDEFNDRLAKLTELGPDELGALIDEMVTAFDAADTAGDLDLMQKLADALDKARSAQSAGGEATPSEPAMAASAEAAVLDPQVDSVIEDSAEATPVVETAETSKEVEAMSDTDTEPSGEEPTNTTETQESAEAEAPVVEEAADEPAAESTDEEPVAEATTEEDTVPITAEDVPDSNKPVAAAAAPVTIRAGGDIPGITAGTTLDTLDDVVDALTRKVNSMRGVSGDGEHVVVASMRFDTDLPDEQILRPGDVDGNSRKIRSLLSDRANLTREALTAGGWCAPRAPIYDVPTAGITDRPVRDFLPSFAADRGGITWVQPPALPDLSGAAGIWRYDDNTGEWGSFTNPEGSGSPGTLKPLLSVPCGDEQSADLEPITQGLCFDNLTARAFPEWIRGNTDLTMVAQSRFAEQVLLSKMFTAAGAASCGTPATFLGAARDFLVTVKLSAASLRWRFRLGANAPLQLLAPSWVRDAAVLDLSVQAPGDDKLSVSFAEVEGYLADANIDPIWYIDDAPTTDAFDICTGFPTSAHWLLFPTGSYLRIDGGSLDLGVVRTKEDVQKNTYCQFAETFESVAYMGPASPNGWVLHGETPIQIEGGTSCCDPMPGGDAGS